jgi:hypothetical protein
MPDELPEELTKMLNLASEGDQDSKERVWCSIYADLREVASRTLGTPKIGERRDPGPTTVVERAFLMASSMPTPNGKGPWKDRKGFFVKLAREMGRFLIKYREEHPANGRGGFARVLPLELDFDAIASFDSALRATDAGVFEALLRLEADHPAAAETVWLRYVCGLTIDQTAELLDIKPRTVCKYWSYAKASIRRDLQAALGRELPELV